MSAPPWSLKDQHTGQEYLLPVKTGKMKGAQDKEKEDGNDLHDSHAPGFVILPMREKQALTVLDHRTGKLYEIPIVHGSISALSFQRMTILPDEEGLKVYDPGYVNTAVTKSSICSIDGDRGILLYRGYPIEELAEHSTFLEVAYLLIYGELPNKWQFEEWTKGVMHHTYVHVKLNELMQSFHHDAHPMGMFISAIAAMGTFHPEANPALQGGPELYKDVRIRNKQIVRLLGKVPTVASFAYRHRMGRPFNQPISSMSYTENFLYMLDHLNENVPVRPHPIFVRALDVLFILHAEHELNCSTAAFRHIISSQVDPYSAMAGGAAALYGPLHGGANEAVLHMLENIGSVDQVAHFLEEVKQKKKKLMGFGHRVYKNYDPRARIIRQVAYEVFSLCGREPLIDVAVELEKRALEDVYFIERQLYPNVDFYSGLTYKAMGFPTDFFPVLFAIPRVAGWLAHWVEALSDSQAKIWRPTQLYVGYSRRKYVPMDHRDEPSKEGKNMEDIPNHEEEECVPSLQMLDRYSTVSNKRYEIAVRADRSKL